MDIYSTRAQLAAIELMPPEYSVLYDFFGHDAGTVEDDKAIYDYRKGSRRMAPMVHPGAGGVLMDRDGFETREIGFCCIAPERIIEDSNLKNRSFGERIIGGMTPQQREKKMLAADLMEMRKAIQRRREWMVRQVLLTGKLSVFEYTNEGRGIKESKIADYGFENNFTPAKKWNETGADIDGDMHKIFDLVYDGMGEVSKIVMSPDVASAMLKNSDFIKQYDLRNADMGKINTKYRGSGLRFIGYNSDGVEMYSLSGTFIDDNQKAEKLIPDGTLIAGSDNILNIYHGPVTQVESEGSNAQHMTYIKKEVPLRYGSIASNAIKNRLTSCPTIVPKNVGGWCVAKVI
ncbi:major capsid protein [Porcincola intestinalis]|uniref:Major capsid protein n=1 Tax=Porcincola intestinalis TaxID=2606632 RepID=A0A6L5X724_9FIRM|nr:major capsid protein [Porcincola intestinalis]MSS16111.1 hypothetical protein [Porcincola intestinalis]